MTKAAEWWADEMEKRTEGRFKVNWGWGNVLAKQTENMPGLKSGLFELAGACPGLIGGQLPLAEVVEFPFMGGTNGLYECRLEWAMSQWQPIKEEAEQRWKAKFLFPFAHPPYEFMGTKRFEKVEDLEGLRVRTSPVVGGIYEKLGAVPVAVPTQELYTAVERGMVDLAAFPWSYTFGSYKIYEVSQYATIGIDMGSFFCGVYVNKTAWDSLPADIKAIHDELMLEYCDRMAADYEAADKKWIPIFKEAGIEIITLPPEEKAKLVAKASEVYEEWIKSVEAKGLPGRDAFEQLKAVRDKVLAGEIPPGVPCK